jgi:hypothetical protein
MLTAWLCLRGPVKPVAIGRRLLRTDDRGRDRTQIRRLQIERE